MNPSLSNDSSQTVMQASKWLQVQVLLSGEEMELFFTELGDVKIYIVGQLTELEKGQISKKDFLDLYSQYVLTLKSGLMPDPIVYRPYFSSVLTLSDDHVFSLKMAEGKQLIRVSLPSVQLQMHMLGYSSIEQKFRPMVLGKDSIHWGIQISYPQLIMDPETKKIEKALDEKRFPNTRLFRIIQKWIRNHTLPTPFEVEGKRINVPMRLGKECFEWINQHPQLQPLGIKVIAREEKG